jgi:flagellar assembly factor FliW
MSDLGTATVEQTQRSGDTPVLEMVQPMAGFPEVRRYLLERLDESGVICDLRAVDNPDLRFVVAPPQVFFDDYAPEVDDAVADVLGATSAEDLFVLVVLTLGATLHEATANLMAPVLVNHRTHRAAQVLLDRSDWPLRAPIAPAGRSGHVATPVG